MRTKLAKKSVNYRPARYTAHRKCGTCVMFRPGGSGRAGACTLVAGGIRARDVCDRWEAK